MACSQVVLNVLIEHRFAVLPLLRSSRSERKTSSRVLEITGGSADIEVIPP